MDSPLCILVWFVSPGLGLLEYGESETEISETFSVHTMLAIQPQIQLTPDPSRQRGLIHQQLLKLIHCLKTLQSDLMEGLTGRQAQNEGSGQCKWTDRNVGLLMHYLKEHSTEWGKGGFKKHTLNSAAEYVNAHGDRQGKLKDLESVRGKFKSVSCTLISPI